MNRVNKVSKGKKKQITKAEIRTGELHFVSFLGELSSSLVLLTVTRSVAYYSFSLRSQILCTSLNTPQTPSGKVPQAQKLEEKPLLFFFLNNKALNVKSLTVLITWRTSDHIECLKHPIIIIINQGLTGSQNCQV